LQVWSAATSSSCQKPQDSSGRVPTGQLTKSPQPFLSRLEGLPGPAFTTASALTCVLACSSATRRARRSYKVLASKVRRCRLSRFATGQTAEGVEVDKDSSISSIMLDLPMVVNQTGESTEERANSVIQHRLMMDGNYQGALSLVERHLDRFDMANMVSALQICARDTKESGELEKRMIQQDPNFVMLFRAIKGEILADVTKAKPRMLATIMWSCAHLNIFDNLLSSTITAEAARKIDEFESMDISGMLFAVGKLGITPPATFIQGLAREMRRRAITDFTPSSIASVVYGCARIGLRDERILKISSDWLSMVDEEVIDDVSLATLIYGYARLEFFDARVFSKLSRRVVDISDSLSGTSISMISLGLALSTTQLQESVYTLEELGRVVVARIDEFENGFIPQYALAMGRCAVILQKQGRVKVKTLSELRFENADPVPNAIIDQVIGKPVFGDEGGRGRAMPDRELREFSLSELNLITYGLMRMGCRNEEYLLRTCPLFARRAAELTDVELVNILYAHAKLQWVHMEMINALVDEIWRRDMLKTMAPIQLATVAYSMALYRLREDWLMEGIVNEMCTRVSLSDESRPSFQANDGTVWDDIKSPAQQLSMVVWACAILNFQTHAEVLTSIALEALVDAWQKEPKECSTSSLVITLWASAVLTGGSSALWMLKAIFLPEFWGSLEVSSQCSMMHAVLATLGAEEGLEVEDMEGWDFCWKIYEENSNIIVSWQNDSLSQLLNMRGVAHRKNGVVPALPGFTEPKVRGDIVVEPLSLIVEVDGPRRWTIPMKKVYELRRTLSGSPDEVFRSVIGMVETDSRDYTLQTGPAVWKRRVVKHCGWKVVTVSWVDEEAFFAEALATLAKKVGSVDPELAAEAQAQAKAEEERLAAEEAAKDEEVDLYGDEVSVPYSEDGPEGLQDVMSEAADVGGKKVKNTAAEAYSRYEQTLRDKHKLAMEELERRLMEERGNAAGTSDFSSYMEFRKWQVKVEKAVFKEMMVDLQQTLDQQPRQDVEDQE